MQTCRSCGADLQENARFCGKCGSVQDALATDAAATGSDTPQPQSWAPEGGTRPATWPPDRHDPAQGSAPAWSANVPAPGTPPPPPVAENEDERRRGIPPWSPLYGAPLAGDALLGSGQASAPGAPVVQGTPQIGSVPSAAGSPSLGASHAAPVSSPVQGAGHAAPLSSPVQGPANPPLSHPAPVSHPVQGPPNVPISHPAPVSHPTPISHPVQGPPNAPSSHPTPISHPVHGPRPTPRPPKQPGTQQHPHPHRHHGHHEPHRGVKTKVLGGSSVKTILIVVTTVVVVAAGGIGVAAHFLARPQPLISITSKYKVGNALAGANGTILHISGQQFSSNSAITLLLDGHVAPGNPGTRSDSNGNFRTNMTITDAWSVGTHTLTARDASNQSTQNSVSVTIVQPGQASTPGPNGAPPDDASFKVIQSQSTAGNPFNTQVTEVVTGHPDPMGGTVCKPEDNGQPIVTTGFTTGNSAPYRETTIYSCTGSYKGGKLTLAEMFTSDVYVISQPDGTTVTCTMNLPQPQIDEQLSGSYTGNNTFSGTITYPGLPDSDYSCQGNGSYFNFDRGGQGNWTGQVTDLHS